MRKIKRPIIGLALGSGGARGLAHIGVIKVLEKNDIPIDFIAGSSIGALFGGFYAAGLGIGKIEEITLNTDWRKVFYVLTEPSLKKGLIEGEKVKTFIEEHINGKRFEDCKIPFSAVATDLKTGETVALNKGKMADAIRASISIPLIFKTVELDGRTLTDGGVSDPVPVNIVKDMGADIVIAVNLDKYRYDEGRRPDLLGIAHNSLKILQHHLAISNSAGADIVLNVDVRKFPWFEFFNGEEKILAGEQAMKDSLPKLLEIIKEN